jgi:precorrin-6x reductase
MDHALTHLPHLGQRILLTTGSKDLSKFTQAAPSKDWFCRVMPDAASLATARQAGIPSSRTIAMVGPFSANLNTAILRDWNISGIITKESGPEGGLQEKLDAAEELKLPIVVIRRPKRDLSHAVQTIEELLSFVSSQMTHRK